MHAKKRIFVDGISHMLVDRVDCHDVLVLGTRVAISDTARDLGVVIV